MPSHHALHALKWSALGNAASRAIGPLVFLVLARLLVPGDFGVVAAATVVISFSQLFADAGLTKAVIQRQDLAGAAANTAFWMNLGFGVLVTGLLFAAAPWIAAWFHDARIAAVVRVLSLQVVLTALGAVHNALLQKDLRFKRLFWVRLLTTAIPGLASIPLALSGFGYWALVAGSLAGQAAQCLLLWRASGWRPTVAFDRPLAGDLLGFGKWAMLSGLLGWFYAWMDATVVGHSLGPHAMGLYRTGSALVSMLFALLTAPLLQVFYSLLCRRSEPARLPTDALHGVVLALSMAACSLAFCLIAARGLLLPLLGAQWAGVEPVVGVLAIVFAMSSFVLPTLEAYRASGRPHLETVSLAACIPVYIAIYVATSASLDTFLDGRLYAAALTIGIHWVLGWRHAGLPGTWAIGPLVLVGTLYVVHRLSDGQPPSILLGAQQAALFAAVLGAVALANLARFRRLAAMIR